MKASSFLKAWAYAELGFIAYLLLREKPITDGLPPDEKAAIENLQRQIKERLK